MIEHLLGKVHQGDCLLEMAKLPDSCVDAIVTDPPYGLSFMGKKWDYDVPQVPVFAQMLRVLKPGGHLLCFGGSRTFHRIAVNIEDAGFDIRDTLMWLYGSGFPKSHNLKGEWQGWGTALKPAHEPIIMARKPLAGTVAENVLKWGTGAINIDGGRVETKDTYHYDKKGGNKGSVPWSGLNCKVPADSNPLGRWPANVIHDGSEEVTAGFPDSGAGNGKGAYSYAGKEYDNKDTSMFNGDKPQAPSNFNDSGSAARFFYCAKTSKADRNEGCEGMEEKAMCDINKMGGASCSMKTGSGNDRNPNKHNHHPTVKPTALMAYLCRLITPPNGIILDPYSGSGSTGKAAVGEGFRFVGFEREADYVEICNKRISAVEIKLF